MTQRPISAKGLLKNLPIMHKSLVGIKDIAIANDKRLQ